MDKDKKEGWSPDKEPISVGPIAVASYDNPPRANKSPAPNTTSTEQGGYDYPGTLSWSPVALYGLPSGQEPHLTPPGPPGLSAPPRDCSCCLI